jgi:hypothetical protein
MPSDPQPCALAATTPQTIPHQCTLVPPHPPPGTPTLNTPLPPIATSTDDTGPVYTAEDASLADAILLVEPTFPTNPPKALTDPSSYSPIDARFLYGTADGAAKWKVDNVEGVEVGLGMKVALNDPYVRKTTYAVIKSVMAMQKGWVLFQLSSDNGSFLITPRSRARLGPLTSLIYLLRYLWLDNTIPPPIHSTGRSLQRSTNYRAHMHSHHAEESVEQNSMV